MVRDGSLMSPRSSGYTVRRYPGHSGVRTINPKNRTHEEPYGKRHSTGKIIKLPYHHRLRLLIRPSGKASWQHRFDFNGKEQIATLGGHPAVSIAEARRRREHNRAMIDDGVNPMLEKRQG